MQQKAEFDPQDPIVLLRQATGCLPEPKLSPYFFPEAKIQETLLRVKLGFVARAFMMIPVLHTSNVHSFAPLLPLW